MVVLYLSGANRDIDVLLEKYILLRSSPRVAGKRMRRMMWRQKMVMQRRILCHLHHHQ